MTAQTFRTDKLLKELNYLYDRRVEEFELMKKHYINGDGEVSNWHEGRATGIRLAIAVMCRSFGLDDYDVKKSNDAYFEMDWLEDHINKKNIMLSKREALES